ncbi:hypothetical protein [Cohnella sp. JJ-181]|uniref:hypothetical protein n=1 Tax=Cohnella rhizoplanae TaxID=2974897 RepID=UPI0023308F63|nr:hypothetical protein [Cohnella sp. JJ-181]
MLHSSFIKAAFTKQPLKLLGARRIYRMRMAGSFCASSGGFSASSVAYRSIRMVLSRWYTCSFWIVAPMRPVCFRRSETLLAERGVRAGIIWVFAFSFDRAIHTASTVAALPVAAFDTADASAGH